MKVLSAILAILIVFLIIQPMIITASFVADNNIVDKCCLDKKNNSKTATNKESSNNCCNNGHCDNPFLSCANCFFTNADKDILVTRIYLKIEKFMVTNDKVYSSYIQSVWHPPQTGYVII